MQDRSQIAMLVGLVILVVVVLTLAPNFHIINAGIFLWSGMLPWILLAVGFWLFFGRGRGCCGKRNDNDA